MLLQLMMIMFLLVVDLVTDAAIATDTTVFAAIATYAAVSESLQLANCNCCCFFFLVHRFSYQISPPDFTI